MLSITNDNDDDSEREYSRIKQELRQVSDRIRPLCLRQSGVLTGKDLLAEADVLSYSISTLDPNSRRPDGVSSTTPLPSQQAYCRARRI